MSLKVGWVHYDAVAQGAPGGKHKGIARGYLKLTYYLWNYLRALGVNVVDAGESVPGHPKLAFHICPPHIFYPAPGKVNVLFSMWEGDALPPDIIQNLKLADWCIVPSRYCQAVWRHHGVEAACVPLGVDDSYVNCDASRPLLKESQAKLRFLFLGSKLGRKGWEFVAPAWEEAFGEALDLELYLKTIGTGKVEKHFDGRVIIDQRDLDDAELLELYRSAAVFVFPSYGEGFGLPALEAMAAGCLVIAPQSSGLTEFIDPYTAIVLEPGKEVVAEYGARFVGRFPTSANLARAMQHAYAGWGTPALETVRRTGTNHARKFTWRASAERLVEVLTAIAERKGIPEEEVLVAAAR